MLLSFRAPDNPALRPFFVSIPGLPARYVEKSARNDPLMAASIATDWPKLVRLMDDIIDFAQDDLTVIEFVELWQLVMRLSSYGLKFDRTFLDWMDEMQAIIGGTHEDSDDDRDDGDDEPDDSFFENDDSELEFDQTWDDLGTCPLALVVAGAPQVWQDTTSRPLDIESNDAIPSLLDANGLHEQAKALRSQPIIIDVSWTSYELEA